ncbi:MAG: hypothetical protein ACYC5O_06110, partial [Anaerolineae bacterium]
MAAHEPMVPTRQTSNLDLDDLRLRSLQPLAALLLIAAVVGAWYYLPNEEFHWRQAGLFLVAVGLALATTRLGQRRPAAALVLLCAGEYGLTLLAAWLLPGVSTLLFCLPIAASTLSMWPVAPLLLTVMACLGQYAVAALFG